MRLTGTPLLRTWPRDSYLIGTALAPSTVGHRSTLRIGPPAPHVHSSVVARSAQGFSRVTRECSAPLTPSFLPKHALPRAHTPHCDGQAGSCRAPSAAPVSDGRSGSRSTPHCACCGADQLPADPPLLLHQETVERPEPPEKHLRREGRCSRRSSRYIFGGY